MHRIDDDGRKAKTKTNPMRDNEDLCDMVLNFIIAGRDTTACCLYSGLGLGLGLFHPRLGPDAVLPRTAPHTCRVI